MTSDQPIIWFTYEREPPHFNGASDSFLGGFAVRWIQEPSFFQNDSIRRHCATSSTTPRKMYRGYKCIKAKGLLLWHEHFSEMDWTKEAEEIRQDNWVRMLVFSRSFCYLFFGCGLRGCFHLEINGESCVVKINWIERHEVWV